MRIPTFRAGRRVRTTAIAPTVAVIGENPWTDDWRMSTEIAGEVIGKAD